MRHRTQPPNARDATILDGGTRIGNFWDHCKSRKKCMKAPYNHLLVNPVLRTDYRAIQLHERGSAADRINQNTVPSRWNGIPFSVKLQAILSRIPFYRNPILPRKNSKAFPTFYNSHFPINLCFGLENPVVWQVFYQQLPILVKASQFADRIPILSKSHFTAKK